MSTKHGIRRRGMSGLLALALCVVVTRMLAGQAAAPTKDQADDAAGFKEFAARVQAYVTLQKKVVASLPGLKSTDLPEMITAYQQALARKIREARPRRRATSSRRRHGRRFATPAAPRSWARTRPSHGRTCRRTPRIRACTWR
jgi:hypothetical protein